jgi:hypothetical protein
MKAKTPKLLHARLLELMTYDRETGVFTWRVDRNQNVRAGDRAGKSHHSGYRYLTIDSERIFEHRVAWFYVNAAWCELQLDHKDTIRDRNVYDNLRPATPGINAQNRRRAQKGTATGLLGVTRRADGRIVAQIGGAPGIKKHIGTFTDPMAAHQAYLDVKRLHHAGCTL